MAYLLEQFGVDDVRGLSEEIKALPPAGTIAEDAQAACVLLRNSLVDEAGSPACALVRLYKTERFELLDPDLQRFARELPDAAPAPDTQCLTLLGTAGDEPAWNDRALSTGHRTIPLPTRELVERLPMVAGLINQLGIDVGDVVNPPPLRDARELASRTNNVFHVEQATGSPFVPAQDFVDEHGIVSAVGFGGIMLSGDFFAVVLFAKVPVSNPVARTLKILAQPIQVRFLPFAAGAAVRS